MIGRIVRNYNTAQVSHHFGSLIASGITILRCLEITQKVVGNSIFQSEIEYMLGKIKGGAALSQSFKEDSKFPGMFVKLIRVGERTGKLPQVIDYMARYYKGIVDTDVKNISTIIEPAIMVLLGLMVAGLVITVIGPIYTLISDVGQT
ncbi:type II secretion system F family protein [Candidatus Peregrinibacteria bacterium]|nr:MAG: type II secretion system F family protein [Candidatus Peregrinibacteria bacterium]